MALYWVANPCRSAELVPATPPAETRLGAPGADPPTAGAHAGAGGGAAGAAGAVAGAGAAGAEVGDAEGVEAVLGAPAVTRAAPTRGETLLNSDDEAAAVEDDVAAERAGTAGPPLRFAATVVAASSGDVREPLAVMTGALLLTPAAVAVETSAEPSPMKGSVTTSAAINALAVQTDLNMY
jgi:hypothetical protein